MDIYQMTAKNEPELFKGSDGKLYGFINLRKFVYAWEESENHDELMKPMEDFIMKYEQQGGPEDSGASLLKLYEDTLRVISKRIREEAIYKNSKRIECYKFIKGLINKRIKKIKKELK